MPVIIFKHFDLIGHRNIQLTILAYGDIVSDDKEKNSPYPE
jgi:hypothetical protein